ncbi:MAG: RluA family pseudouridine synthase [Dehalococcoidia bacterium]|nr:RluA family pseudouridine synthase [Dehalococcoidia bacterium]
MKRVEFTATAFDRLDRAMAGNCGVSRAYAQRLIDQGHVTVANREVRVSHKLKVKPGDRIHVDIPPAEPLPLVPEDIPLQIVYEDRDLMVIDKPAGMVVHPAPGKYTGTLVHALLARCPELNGINGLLRPGIVHRLDKDTSGLIVIARHAASHLDLSRQMKERTARKVYVALVAGQLTPERGSIEAPIGRHPRERKLMAVVAGGREARTSYRVLGYVGSYTLVEAVLETGRTHQIRVHFASIGHPVVGDRVYGRKTPILPRQFLHAHILGFRLPSSGEYIEFRSPLPPDLSEALERLGLEPSSGLLKALQ